MKVIVICGSRKRGKTTIVKKIISGVKDPLIFDPNNEYGEPYISVTDFIKKAQEAKNKTIIFEEATGFFSTTKNIDKMLEILIRVRHTNNLIVFVYHSLNRIPMYLFEQTSLLILKKTNDTEANIKKKFKGNDEIISRFLLLQDCSDDKSNQSFYNTTEINLI